MRQQRKHIVAAHRAIHKDGEKIIESHKIKPRDSLIKLTSKLDLSSSQSQILTEEDEKDEADGIPNDDHHNEERKDEL